MRDADPDEVAGAVIGGMNFTWCGQSCGSTSRAFIHENIHDAVIERIKARIAHFKPGIPTDPATTMGAIVSKAQFDRVLSYIDAAKKEGARVIAGGGPPADPALANGFYIEPTVFADVTMSMRIAREEIFGPVLGVFKWSDEAKMLAEVNAGRIRPHRLDLDQRSIHRASHRHGGGGRLRLDQRGRQALPRRAVRRLQAVGPRARGMLRGDALLHAGEEHPREAEAGAKA